MHIWPVPFLSFFNEIKRDLLDKWPFKVEFGDEVFKPCSALVRSQWLISYLKDQSLTCLWAVKGGEGTADLIPYLLNEIKCLKKIPPKIVIGSSDVTALIVFLEQKLGWPVIHGPNAIQVALKNSDRSISLIKHLIAKEHEQICFPLLKPINDIAKQSDILYSQGCTGGNLSLLNTSINDVWEFHGNDKFVFIEECGEKAHVIDRTLKYLNRIGKFNSAKALIIGDIFNELAGPAFELQNQYAKYLSKQIKLFANLLPIPVLSTPNIGHGNDNCPIPLRWDAKLVLGNSPSLTLISPPDLIN